MNQYEEEHLKRKNEIADCLSKIEKFVRTEIDGPNMLPELKAEYNKAAEVIVKQRENLKNGEFSIVLIGEFSAGKSTFLNALMGERLLPSFTSETTATINYLRHKNRSHHGEEGCVYYENGTTKELDHIDFETITKYVSTRGDDVASKVSHLDLFLDSRLLENNVTLVDSPGLGGMAKGHKERTENQIRSSSACIFVFNAEQPGKETDFAVLDNLHSKLNSIICVLNKIDAIKVTEGESEDTVIAKIKENYKIAIPDAKNIPEILPVSAGAALAARDYKNIVEYDHKTEFSEEDRKKLEEMSRMSQFEDRLWRYLTQGEKTKQTLIAPIEQTISQLSKLKKFDKEELDILNGVTDIDEIESQRLELEKRKNELSAVLEENTRAVKNDIKKAREELLEEIEAEGEKLKNTYALKLDQWQSIDDIESSRIKENLEILLNKVYETAMDNFQESLGNIILEYKDNAVDEINSKLDIDFKFCLEKDIKQEPDTKLGLEKYHEEINAIRKELDELDDALEENKNKMVQAMERDNKKMLLEQKLARKEAAREHYQVLMETTKPEIYRNVRKTKKDVSRGGLIGNLEKLLFGNKVEFVDEIVVDDSERREHNRMMNERLEKFDGDIGRMEKELDDIPVSNKDGIEFKRRQIEKRRQQKMEEQKRVDAEFKEQAGKKIAERLKRQKENVGNYIDESISVFKKQSRKVLREQMDGINQAVNDIIASEITAQINNSVSEIELLKKQAEDAVNNKETKKKVIIDRLNIVKQFLNELLDLQNSIEAIEVDKIQKQTL